jgi:23S rRNA-/tRNA-specific pseudouridylate synthase/SAM-dependent methyltransferase
MPAPATFLPGGTRIVHEDRDVIVVDKPTGILSASMPGDDLDSVFRTIKVHNRQKVKRRGTQMWIIHRLDKEASGLLVFAKTADAFESLKEQFRAKRVHRIYSAVVDGEFSPIAAGEGRVPQLPSGTIQSYLIEDEEGIVKSSSGASAPAFRRGGKDQQSERSEPEAKLAITHYRVVTSGQGRSLLQVRLETGRKNQIRVHMKEFGHPIVGDRRYGSEEDPADRVCLHATELSFTSPSSGKTLRFVSPPPAAFFRLVGRKGTEGTTHETADWSEKGQESLADRALAAERAAAAHVATAPIVTPGDKIRSGSSVAGSSVTGSGQTSSWDHVADWYNTLIEDRGSDHHEKLLIPGAVRLLDASKGQRVLDVACGQGILCRALATLGIHSTGVDASPRLIEAAARIRVHGGVQPAFVTGDARALHDLKLPKFDAATCVMALMNIEPLSPVLSGVASILKPRGKFVSIILHPAFRSPGQTSWGWDNGSGATPKRDGPPKAVKGRPGRRPAVKSAASTPGASATQFRRVDGYLSNGRRSVVMNPGAAATGKEAVTTWTYHRPVQTYIKLLAEAGFAVDALEEWPSLRVSQPGPTAAEENRARREIPMFLALRAVLL